MAKEHCIFWLPILVLFVIFVLGSYSVDAEESSRSNYIVHVRLPSGNDLDLHTWYESLLQNADGSSIQEQRIIHRYRHAATGFAAKLTLEEVKALREKDDVLHVIQEKVYSLHTTLTPKFLGLNQGLRLWNGSSSGKGVIIGVLDTGITPGHPSFGDEGMDPPPAKWKGQCEFKVGCNNKLIGSRNFVSSDPSAVDDVGHGTHTSSTAAGHVVEGANALGMANGTASGIAPLAHVAMYKVCMESGCPESSILAGLDAAIEDGVDVLSISLGGGSVPFSIDNIAIGTFAAVQKGIFVSCSAGNDGPEYSTLSNEAPWILTVGASTIDRSIRATAHLGNGQEFDGESLYQPSDFPPTLLPLVYPGAISGSVFAAQCLDGSLNSTMVKGKVVVCDIGGGRGRVAKGQEVKNAGGAAMILINEEIEGYTTLVDDHVLPAAHVNYAAAVAIKAYLNSTSNATATILFKGTIIGNSTAPVVSFFSSRGPSQASPGILKPDIIGPGVSILAAWPEPLDNSTKAKSTFYVASGTSMSCPHLSGVAALIKSSHPDWSVAAIKSAIMTSADITTLSGTPSKIPDQTMGIADYYAIGSGHVNPSRANDPGLVFDIEPTDYIPYLCGLGYSDSEIEVITKSKVQCAMIKPITESELNYPSITVKLGSSPVTYSRVVKNVGPAKSRYTSVIINPESVDISVGPGDLKFTEAGETITYYVTFTRNQAWNNTITSSRGYLNWVSPTHTVRTPLLVIFE